MTRIVAGLFGYWTEQGVVEERCRFLFCPPRDCYRRWDCVNVSVRMNFDQYVGDEKAKERMSASWTADAMGRAVARQSADVTETMESGHENAG